MSTSLVNPVWQLMIVAIFSSTAVAQLASAGHTVMESKNSMSKSAKLGLEGYCPVCIIDAKKWEKGSPEIRSTYDGITYYFPSEAIKKKFDVSPSKYVPALGGDCIVCYEKAGKRMPGSIRHSAMYKGRLYLFPSDGEKQAFLKSAADFANTDLAANGECVVCLAKVNKHVAGSSEFTEIHNGLRYLFPSANEAAEFRRSPERYLALIANMQKGNSEQTGMKKEMKHSQVQVLGTSACAGCEFGVTPLSSPEELGLALKTNDGKVVVVENAHELYPEIYAARFQGQQLQAEGQIIKIQGDIAWLKPDSLRVMN